METASAALPKKTLCQLHDIGQASTQRRHLNLDTIQSIEQVGPERSRRDQLRETTIGGCDNSSVNPLRVTTADSLHRGVLHRPEELGLCCWRQVAYLVQKQRSTVRVFELSVSTSHPSCRAILDPEQLHLHERLHERSAIDGHERTSTTCTPLVKAPRDEFLSGPGFTFDEDRNVGICHLIDSSPNIAHGRTAANELGLPDRR